MQSSFERKNKLFPTIEEANLRLSLPNVIKGSFHMARSDAHPLFQVVEISLGITNTSSLTVSSSDWKTKSSTNICGLVASQNVKGLPNLGSLEPKTIGTQRRNRPTKNNEHLPGGSSRGWPERHLHGLGAWVGNSVDNLGKDGESLSHVDEQSGEATLFWGCTKLVENSRINYILQDFSTINSFGDLWESILNGQNKSGMKCSTKFLVINFHHSKSPKWTWKSPFFFRPAVMSLWTWCFRHLHRSARYRMIEVCWWKLISLPTYH